jgi:hypothetical protein
MGGDGNAGRNTAMTSSVTHLFISAVERVVASRLRHIVTARDS